MGKRGRKPDARLLAEQLRRNLKRRKQRRRAEKGAGEDARRRLTDGEGRERTPGA